MSARARRSSGAAAHGLAALPNLGVRSASMLDAAGIHSEAELRALGAVAAYARVKRSGARPGLNLLWALEGALSGIPWQIVAREHRTSLLLALEDEDRGASAGLAGNHDGQRSN